MTHPSLSILVVDDSALYRQSIVNVLREIPDVHVVGTAKDGVDALAKIEELSPDLVTLDVQMPDMDGIQVLRTLKRRRHTPRVIMVSSLTAEGAQVTTEALMEGAFDFSLKPAGGDPLANRQRLQSALAEKIQAIAHTRQDSQRSASTSRIGSPERDDESAGTLSKPVNPCRLVLIGTSTGGPEALKKVLPKLAEQLAVPVLVVQHMPPHYTGTLAARLDAICPLHVLEASDGQSLEAGQILLAPGGKHMRLKKSEQGVRVRITEDAAVNGVRPSYDALLNSAVEIFKGDALAVVLTGMGRDGLEGCRGLKQAGGYVFAQGQSDCVVYGMPKAVVEAELVDRILPLGKVAPAILRHVKRSQRPSTGGQA